MENIIYWSNNYKNDTNLKRLSTKDQWNSPEIPVKTKKAKEKDMLNNIHAS